MALIPVMPSTKLKNGLEVCKIINGMWQVSGAHGNIEPQRAVLAMNNYADVGFTSFDMADIYGPAEDIFGTFIKSRGVDMTGIRGLTKMVPRVGEMTREKVEKLVTKSMHRMSVDKLDCLQFHWWDYSDKRYLDAMKHLRDIQVDGKIKELSLTNFSTEVMEEIVGNGIPISTNQVQFSLVDTRPQKRMAEFCEKNSIKLFAYGVLCGGLLSEKYLGVAEPKPHELITASLSKYKHIIDLWGGWALFQELLQVVHTIAEEHTVSIANVATRYILDQPVVASVIIGCRFGIADSDHTEDNFRSISQTWSLTKENLATIEAVQNKSNDLFSVLGDCGGEYR
uniref:Aldo-keto reductase family 1, member C21 n=1 Tax=Phallusia mammillata TaxID=59560 RepID=A0A6F9D5F5_9ASCI|nr:Aldo-keto reductase family 1, member C21 [Phallusia mammillata]